MRSVRTVGDGEPEDREQAEDEERQAHRPVPPRTRRGQQVEADGRRQEGDAVEAAVEGVDRPWPEIADRLGNDQQREPIEAEDRRSDQEDCAKAREWRLGSAGGKFR